MNLTLFLIWCPFSISASILSLVFITYRRLLVMFSSSLSLPLFSFSLSPFLFLSHLLLFFTPPPFLFIFILTLFVSIFLSISPHDILLPIFFLHISSQSLETEESELMGCLSYHLSAPVEAGDVARSLMKVLLRLAGHLYVDK